MASVKVGTSAAVLLPIVQGMVQNKGPGVVYVGGSKNVTVDDGIEVPVGAAIMLGRSLSVNRWWAVAGADDTELRVADGVLGAATLDLGEPVADESSSSSSSSA